MEATMTATTTPLIHESDLLVLEEKARDAATATSGGHWEAWTNGNGETKVSEVARHEHAHVATPHRDRPDRASRVGEHIAAADPATVLYLMDELRKARRAALPPF